MSLALALIAAAVPSLTFAEDECSSSQRGSGCCEPFGDIANLWAFSSTGGGSWTGTDSAIRYDFANDQKCGGDADETQEGVATLNLNTVREAKLVISAKGLAEANYESFDLFVDDNLVVTVKAVQSGSCQPNTCIMCGVDLPPEELVLSPGPHKVEVKVTSRDELYHQGAFFEIDFALNADECGGCVCSPPAPAPADGGCVLTLEVDDENARRLEVDDENARRLEADGGAAARKLETVHDCGPEGIGDCGRGMNCFALFNEAVRAIQDLEDGSSDPGATAEEPLCSLALEATKAGCPECDACGVFTDLPPEPVGPPEPGGLHALPGAAAAEPGASTAIVAAALLSLLLGSLVALRRRRVTIAAGWGERHDAEEDVALDRHPLAPSS